MLNKRNSLLLCLVVVLLIGVGATVALLVTNTITVTNNFNATKVSCKVNEDIDLIDAIKKDVCIENTGTTDAYIRAEVVITWKNEAGEAYGQLPARGTDYTITYGTDSWFEAADGYFYYTKPVAATDATKELIEECKARNTLTAEDGTVYYLSVEILAEAIQADGGSGEGENFKYAVEQAWGVTVNKVVDGDTVRYYISK